MSSIPDRGRADGDRVFDASRKGQRSAGAFFDRQRTIAPPGYNRFLVPPAALAVHLSIGQAYAFSTFNLPLTRLIGITSSAPGDWTLVQLGWIFSIAILFLGASAALFGRWVERAGPRKAMFIAACCFGGGFLISAAGITTCTGSGFSMSAMASSAAAGSASAISRQFRR